MRQRIAVCARVLCIRLRNTGESVSRDAISILMIKSALNAISGASTVRMGHWLTVMYAMITNSLADPHLRIHQTFANVPPVTTPMKP